MFSPVGKDGFVGTCCLIGDIGPSYGKMFLVLETEGVNNLSIRFSNSPEGVPRLYPLKSF